MPSTELLEAMGEVQRGAGQGRRDAGRRGPAATSKGARVRFEGGERTVIDGPFTEAKEIVAGYWIWQCDSREEAIEWLKRAPFDGGTEIELRQIAELEDFEREPHPRAARGKRAPGESSSARARR